MTSSRHPSAPASPTSSRLLHISLRSRLIASFGICTAVVVGLAALGLWSLQTAASETDHLYATETVGLEQIMQANVSLTAAAKDQFKALAATDPAKRGPLVQLTKEELAAGAQAFATYEKSITNEADRKQYEALKVKVNKVNGDRAKLLDILGAGDLEGAQKASAAMQNDIGPMYDGLAESTKFKANLARDSHDRVLAKAASSRQWFLGVAALAAAAAFVIAFFLIRSITRPVEVIRKQLTSVESYDLAALRNGIAAVERGDLTVQATPVTQLVANPGTDELGQIERGINGMVTELRQTMAGYNAMREGLAEIVSGVGENAQSVLSAADQLQEASDQMAAATGQIATAINEVTRSTVSLSSLSQESAQEVEQVGAGSQELANAARSTAGSAAGSRTEANSMGDHIAQVATQSEEVAASASDSRQAAEEGQKAVMQAVASMEAIAKTIDRTSRTVDQLGEYGQQIGDIVKVIDEIAAQTNLLALNAAIEAARAGEQGRGFAVVADNVRTLAERSSQSTKEIAELISKVQSGTQEAVEAMAAGVKDVQEGREITTQAGEALKVIITSVQDATSRMQGIAKDVQGLSAGAERIVSSADEIAELAEATAAGAGMIAESATRVTGAIIQVSATSEETSASAEEVSASTEELSAQSEELAATASTMKELARKLNAAANRFTWDKSRTA